MKVNLILLQSFFFLPFSLLQPLLTVLPYVPIYFLPKFLGEHYIFLPIFYPIYTRSSPAKFQKRLHYTVFHLSYNYPIFSVEQHLLFSFLLLYLDTHLKEVSVLPKRLCPYHKVFPKYIIPFLINLPSVRPSPFQMSQTQPHMDNLFLSTLH